MDRLYEAITFNNEGARLLTAGNTIDAVHAIRTAVLVLKQCPLDASTVVTTTAATSTNNNAAMSAQTEIGQCYTGSQSSPAATGPLDATCKSDDSDMLPSCEESSPDGVMYRHCRPVMISAADIMNSNQDFASLVHTFTTIVVFNLALACHQFGIVSGTDAPLQRAIELYNVVWTSTPAEIMAAADTAARCPTMTVLQCLALNNLAHLYYEHFCEYDYSTSCMEQMCDFIAQTECLEHDHCHALLSPFEAEEIKLNVMYAEAPVTAGAA